MDRSNYTGYLGFGKNSRPRLSSPGKNYSPFSGKKKYFSRKKSLFLPPFFESRKSIQEDLPVRGNKKGGKGFLSKENWRKVKIPYAKVVALFIIVLCVYQTHMNAPCAIGQPVMNYHFGQGF